MKKQKKKRPLSREVELDDMTYGDVLPHHIGKKTTEKVHNQKQYSRKPKHRKGWENDMGN